MACRRAAASSRAPSCSRPAMVADLPAWRRAHAAGLPGPRGGTGGPGSWPSASRRARALTGASPPRFVLTSTRTSSACSARPRARPASSSSSGGL
jgi:hypothetical protein